MRLRVEEERINLDRAQNPVSLFSMAKTHFTEKEMTGKFERRLIGFQARIFSRQVLCVNRELTDIGFFIDLGC